MKRRQWATVGITLLCLPWVVGCGQSVVNLQQDEQHGFSAAVQLYQTNCASCHGDGLEGDIGPSLTHVASTLTAAQIQHQIYYGGGPMPGYGSSQQAILSNSEIHTLVTWLQTKK